MKFGINKKYLTACIGLFLIETVIAIFIHDDFIRPYLGDVLVVALIYCFIKSFLRNETRLLPLHIFIFAALVEIGQYFDAAQLLGLGDNRIARIIIGSSFDLKDITCYLIGCAGLFLFERSMRKGRQ